MNLMFREIRATGAGRGLVLAMVFVALVEGASAQLVTNIGQIQRLSENGQKNFCEARFEATVLFANAKSGRLVLHDFSGDASFEADLRGQSFKPGTRVALDATCLIDGAALTLNPSMSIDNDGLHPVLEKSEKVYLSAGRCPLRVSAFNGIDEFILDVFIQGPQLPRQKISDSSLFRLLRGDEKEPIWTNGLDFRCFEGDWNAMPDFNRLTAVKSGSVSNFDVRVASRLEKVAVEFNGFVEVPRSGFYTFSITSDDGSRLQISNCPPQITVVGTNSPPMPRQFIPGQFLAREEMAWAEVEGSVTFAATDGKGLILELSSDLGRTRVEVQDGDGLSPVSLSKSRARITGLLNSTFTADGNPVAGALSIHDGSQIVRVGGTNEGSLVQARTLYQVERIKGMKRDDALRGLPVKIRGVLTLYSGDMKVIQDSTGSIFFMTGSPPQFEPKVGDYCELEGVTAPGDFAPIVVNGKLTRLGQGALPEHVHPTLDQLMNGSLDTQYIEVQGVVTEAREGRIELLTPMGRVNMAVAGSQSFLKPYENALVRVRGVLIPAWDKDTHGVKYGQMELLDYSICIDEPALKDPFDLPLRHVPELQLFDKNSSTLQRVRMSGIVLHGRDGQYFLMDSTNGFRIVPKQKAALRPGDFVDVVGYPELGTTASPVLHDAVFRKTGKGSMPEPISISGEDLLNSQYDARLVKVEGRVVALTSTPGEQVMEVQTGSRTFSARLRKLPGADANVAPGYEVSMVAVYVAHGGRRNVGVQIDSFELLLNYASDLTVLSKPSWWTLGHTLATVAVVLSINFLGIQWISQLRRRVEERTRQLREEIDRHKRTEVQLHEKTAALQQEITERQHIQTQLIEKKNLLEDEIEERKKLEAEKDQIHKELVTASRKAGMAEVATGVLHNVGNVLNSINVSTTLLFEKTQNSRSVAVGKVSSLMEENSAQLAQFLTQDEKGRKLPGFLKLLAQNLAAEKTEIEKELQLLRDNVDHVKEIVAMQQSHGSMSAVMETVALSDLVETALKMQTGSYQRHGVQLKREFEEVPPVKTDRHKVLQILINLLQNAKQACDDSGREDKQVVVRVRKSGQNWVTIEVVDNGVGVPPENLTRIFQHGFTTRKTGHGFGLHSGALAAKELGGSLTVTSDGPGQGAAFCVEVPISNPLV